MAALGIKMKNLFFSSLLLFSYSVSACVAPRGGEEYDALIKVERVDRNHYKVTVPEKLEDLQSAEIMLAYSEHHAGGVPVYDPYENLEPEVRNGESTAEFSIEKRLKTRPYIVVMWWPKECCPCGIQANTGFIEPE